MKSWKKFEYKIKYFLEKQGFKAERVPLSGALGIVSSALKSDVVAEKDNIKLRIDAKYTLSKDKIILQKETMEKIEEEAEEGETPLVVFSFYNHRILYALIKKELLNYQGKIHERRAGRKFATLKKEEICKKTKEGAVLLSFKGGGEYLILRLAKLIEML